MPLSSSYTMQVVADLTKVLDLSTGRVPLSKVYSSVMASGTAAGQADIVFQDTRTLAPSANEDLDLNGTTLQDPFGVNLALLRVKGILISAAAANVNNVIVGAAAATQWATLLNATGTVTLRPGATFAAWAGVADGTGYAVVAGASDFLRVANSGAGTSVNYDIIIVGCSA